MELATAIDCAADCIAADIPFFLHGSPGTGKTDSVGQLCERLSYENVTESIAGLESVDLRGLPGHDGSGGVVWSRPDFMIRCDRAKAASGRNVLLFIDEVNAVPVSVQVPLMQLALTRRIGPHALPDGTRLAFAGNLLTDRAAAQRMGTAFNNRVAHFDIDSPASVDGVKAWSRWAASNKIHPMVIAFLMLRGAPNGTPDRPGYAPGLLHWFNPQDANARAFPSPRSWALVSRIADAPLSRLRQLVAALVGETAANEFMGFVSVFKSAPPVSAILANPAGAAVPSEPGVQYAVSLALARAATPTNFDSVLTYVQRMGSEFEIVTATDAVRRNPDLTCTSAFISWAARNSDVTI
jgi:hypothetical protein